MKDPDKTKAELLREIRARPGGPGAQGPGPLPPRAGSRAVTAMAGPGAEPVRVSAYAGGRGAESPRSFTAGAATRRVLGVRRPP